MRNGLVSSLIALGLSATVACAPPTATPTGQQPAGGGTAPSATKTLDMAVRYEVNDLLPKRTGGAAATYSKRAFNAMLALVDSQAAARPYLAESLPQLNQDTWQVSPDGHMVTTYTLRPNLTWQDGQPFTADDFVFAYQVYSEKAMGGTFISSPQDQIEDITGRDARTLVIRWKALYPQAGALAWQALDPLPKHILESSFATVQQDATNLEKFLSLPFWTTEYIGAGPFKLNKWEPGSSLDGSAFDGHALGRPKIDHIVIHFIPDENTVLTNVLSGAVQLAGDTSIRFEQAIVLQQQWGDTGGKTLMHPGTRHWIFMQFRPDYQKTPALLDVRVRRALATAIDRPPLNDAIFNGQGIISDHFVPPQMPYASDVDKAVTHYPFDPRQAAQMMTDAGLTKDSGGFFQDASGQRFKPQFLTDGSPIFEREMSIIQGQWAGAGIDMDPQILPGNVGNVNENRTTFSGLYASSTGIMESQMDIFAGSQIATAQRGWAGQNRGGWLNEDYNRLWNAFNTTLDRMQRNQQIIDMEKILTDQLPGTMLYFNISPEAFTSVLKVGPQLQTPETLANWNMSDWEMQ